MYSQLESFAKDLDGLVIDHRQPNYKSACHSMVWNAFKPERYPFAIINAKSEQDIVKSVKFAQRMKLPLSIRSGGYSWHGNCLRDNSLLLNLSWLCELSVNRTQKNITFQPGVTNKELIDELVKFDLAFPVGFYPNLGMGGFLLSGGIGLNSGSWGPSCYSIMAVDFVDQHGEIITATEKNNFDFLWATRGAGQGFFGIVTKFYAKAYALPKPIQYYTYEVPLEKSMFLTEFLDSIIETLPNNIEVSLMMLTKNNKKFLELAINVYGNANNDKVQQILSSTSLKKSESSRGETSFQNIHQYGQALYPDEHYYLVDSHWSNGKLGKIITQLKSHFAKTPSAQTRILIEPLTTTQPSSDITRAAFSVKGKVLINSYSIWQDDCQTENVLSWQQKTNELLQSLSLGCFIGEANYCEYVSPESAFHDLQWQKINSMKKGIEPNIFSNYF